MTREEAIRIARWVWPTSVSWDVTEDVSQVYVEDQNRDYLLSFWDMTGVEAVIAERSLGAQYGLELLAECPRHYNTRPLVAYWCATASPEIRARAILRMIDTSEGKP